MGKQCTKKQKGGDDLSEEALGAWLLVFWEHDILGNALKSKKKHAKKKRKNRTKRRRKKRAKK